MPERQESRILLSRPQNRNERSRRLFALFNGLDRGGINGHEGLSIAIENFSRHAGAQKTKPKLPLPKRENNANNQESNPLFMESPDLKFKLSCRKRWQVRWVTIIQGDLKWIRRFKFRWRAIGSLRYRKNSNRPLRCRVCFCRACSSNKKINSDRF